MDGGYLYAFSDSIYQSLQGQMSEATLNSGVVDGKLYGISYTPNSYFMYYDSSKVTAEEAKDLDKVLSKGKVILILIMGIIKQLSGMVRVCVSLDQMEKIQPPLI